MFESFVENYKVLDLSSKRKEIIKEVKMMLVILEKMCIDNNIKYREVKSKEILALSNENCSEDDYLEALFVYIQYLKEVLGSYLYNDLN